MMDELRNTLVDVGTWTVGRWFAYPVLALLCVGALASVVYLWGTLPEESEKKG